MAIHDQELLPLASHDFIAAMFAVLLAGATVAVHADDSGARTILTPERVSAEPDLSGPVARGAELSPDGSWLTFLQPRDDDRTRLDLWIAPATGDAPARRLVDSAALEGDAVIDEAERGRRERQRISDRGVVEYAWDGQGRRLLVPLAGELYVVDVATGSFDRRVARAADGSGATDGRFSPRGTYLGFVRNGSLFIAPVTGGPERAVTPPAHDAVRYGVAEFIAQEEMARDTGYWWSPDETAIAYTRVDETEVDIARRVEIGVAGTTVVEQRFPRAGHANARVDLFVQRLAGDAPVAVDLGADRDVYVARVNWSADGRLLYVQRQSRDQQTLDLLAIDPATGRFTVVLSEHWAPWVNLSNGFTPLRGGGFLWESERSGYRHLYLYDPDARLVRAVTSGAFPLAGVDRTQSLAGVDERRGLAYVVASKDTALERHLYVVDYRRGGPMRQLTRGDGWWSVKMNRKATAFIGSYSSFTTPPQTALYGADGRRRRWIVENRLDASHPYYPYLGGLPTPEFGQLTAEDGQKLDWVLLKPIAFDPRKHYPAIVEVYGGPGRQKVSKAWRSPAERLYLEAGFVVFQLDNRGASNRGLKFEAPIARSLGSPEVRDQIVGLRFLQQLPYVDPSRVGVTGWSYGGFMTLRLLTEPGAGFAAGAAGAPVSDWRLYDTHYTERFLGTPQADAPAYEAAAILPRLKNLRGRLLYMHGMADDNVLLENGTTILAELQRLGVPFDLMLYPGQRHSIVGPALQLQQWRTWLEFFRRTLGGPKEPGAVPPTAATR